MYPNYPNVPPVLDSTNVPPLEVIQAKKTLHWYQWTVYTVVLITCLAVLYAMVDTYLFIHHLQQALLNLSNSFKEGFGQ